MSLTLAAIGNFASKSLEAGLTKIESSISKFRDVVPKYIENKANELNLPGSKSNPFKLPRCLNRSLEGQTINGVTFKSKIFKIHGVYVEGVFPEFEGIKVTLNGTVNELYNKLGRTDSQFYKGTMKEATKALKAYLEEHPEEKKNFTEQQLKDIAEEKEKITGKIWHHYEELDENGHPIMQLVDEKQHAGCKHTGGSYTWNPKNFENKYGDTWREAVANALNV